MMDNDASPERDRRPGLPIELHAATREKHRALNVAIMAHLPLCLPPATSSPMLYAKGMIVFGQIYFAFEDEILATLERHEMDARLRAVYRHIYLPQLLRTASLRADLDTLRTKLGRTLHEEIDLLEGRSCAFYERIRKSLTSKPHVILAYAWTMYLALFNGGRWIRRQLAFSGSDFWRGNPPLSFWDFEEDGNSDNDEQLKQAFKDGFDTASSLLEDREKDDVVDESKALFGLCSELVEFLQNLAISGVSLQPAKDGSASSMRPTEISNINSIVNPIRSYLASGISSLKTTAAGILGKE